MNKPQLIAAADGGLHWYGPQDAAPAVEPIEPMMPDPEPDPETPVLSFVADFATADDYHAYATHPRHVEVVTTDPRKRSHARDDPHMSVNVRR